MTATYFLISLSDMESSICRGQSNGVVVKEKENRLSDNIQHYA